MDRLATEKAIRSIVLISGLVVMTFIPGLAKAGDIALYAKTGYIDLNEKVAGKQYVSEQGAVSEIGLVYKNRLKGIEVDPSLGVWGAVLRYEGSSLDLNAPAELKSTTGFYGVNASLPASKLYQVTDNISVGPLAGIDAAYFVRTVGERWLVFSAKAGIRAKIANLELSGGALYPFYTADTIYGWPTEEFTVHPKGRVTAFADLNYSINKRWGVGAYYKMWRWSASENVNYKYTGNNTNSAIASGSSAYQPDTIIINAGFAVIYHFGY